MATNVLNSLNAALHKMLSEDPRVVVVGEDLLDPYGGAFKVTKGLSTKFPERVLTTPLSEAGFTALAAGMAIRGLRPIVEIMFGDFLMLAADQIINHIGKYRWMYNDKVRVPLVIRTPMGGRRGYGPTHSQTLEKHFIGAPGWHVVAPSPFHEPGALLYRAVIEDDDPVLFIENKAMYARPVRETPSDGRLGDFHARTTAARYPTVTLSFDSFSRADVTLVAYGGMAELAETAAEQLLMREEIFCEVVVPSSLSPLDLEPILESLKRTGKLVVCEEGTQTAGWGAELIAAVSAQAFELLHAPPLRVAAKDIPIANTSTLETAILPQLEDIDQAILRVCANSRRVVTR
jgi:acetoin:2,6-dichlorophenolindophenol oxidoreductase subunit beta